MQTPVGIPSAIAGEGGGRWGENGTGQNGAVGISDASPVNPAVFPHLPAVLLAIGNALPLPVLHL